MREWSLEDTIKTEFQISMSKMYTALPCIVTNVVGELANQRIDVQPSINRLYKDGTDEEQPQMLALPVMFPGSGSSLISWPIAVGDTVFVVFAQRSMDNFKAGNGQPTTPNDYRKMDVKDGVAFPGLVPFGKSLNNPAVRKWPHSTRDLVISHNIASSTEVEIRLTESGNVIINTEQDVAVNGKNVIVTATDSISLNAPKMSVNVAQTTWTGNIIHQGNYTMTGMARFNGVLFDTHFHGGVLSGNSVSGPVAG